jgi:hypothetical protein
MSSKTEKFMELLTSHPNGVTVKEACKSIKSTTTGVYSIVSTLRNKMDFEIQQSKGKYFLPEKSTQSPKIPPGKFPIIDSSFLKKISILSEGDQDDCFDMIKKSIFYKMTAEALVNSAEMVERIKAII